MKLWLISQNEQGGYDTYDSAVVAAENELDARRTHPSEHYVYSEEWHEWGFLMADGRVVKEEYSCGSWARRYQSVSARYIGEAKEETKAGVICASFNAG